MKIKSVILLGLALLLSSTLFAQAGHEAAPAAPAQAPAQPATQTPGAPTLGLPTGGASMPAPTLAQGPMEEKDVLIELKKEGADQLLKDLKSRGVNFEVDEDFEKKLHKAKATDQVIQAVKAAGPKERAAAEKAEAISSGALDLSPEETKDINALQIELDPDKAIGMAEAYVKKYPKSLALSQAYAFEAHAYQLKNNVDATVQIAQKSLAVKPDNLVSLGIIAAVMPSQQYLNMHQADEEKQLAQAENYVQQAFKAIAILPKPISMSDADFAKQKANLIGDLHGDLGMIHLDRAQLGLMSLDTEELAKGVEEYKKDVATADQPDPVAYFRMGDCYRLLGKWDDAIAAYTKTGEISHGRLKQLADAEIEKVKKLKAQPPAQP
jgi:tetratricopeptide (TPR) repeat protein